MIKGQHHHKQGSYVPRLDLLSFLTALAGIKAESRRSYYHEVFSTLVFRWGVTKNAVIRGWLWLPTRGNTTKNGHRVVCSLTPAVSRQNLCEKKAYPFAQSRRGHTHGCHQRWLISLRSPSFYFFYQRHASNTATQWTIAEDEFIQPRLLRGYPGAATELDSRFHGKPTRAGLRGLTLRRLRQTDRHKQE